MYHAELQTRALETHTYVMASNRAGYEQVEGEEELRHHFGKSAVIDPIGNIIEAADATPWTYVTGEFDTDKLEWANKRWNWRRDRRPELYGLLTDESLVTPGKFEYDIQ